jgi:hypothetical protein
MINTADVIGGKPIAVWSQSISGVNVNPLVAFYDIHGIKWEVLFFYFVPDITRHLYHSKPNQIQQQYMQLEYALIPHMDVNVIFTHKNYADCVMASVPKFGQIWLSL